MAVKEHERARQIVAFLLRRARADRARMNRRIKAGFNDGLLNQLTSEWATSHNAAIYARRILYTGTPELIKDGG